MKNQELFNRTIGILVNAYLNGVLVYSDCSACAVGNLIAANCGYKVVRKGMDFYHWEDESRTDEASWHHVILMGRGKVSTSYNNHNSGVMQLLRTGYSLQECALIERAFYLGCIEINDGYYKTDDEHFNGLMAVCDTLMQIHEATPEEIKTAKRLFVKEPA